jgi:hypothetical protein
MQSRRNDDERRLWVLNDEPLYMWYRSARTSIRAFIKANRAEIDSAIDAELNRKPLS